MASERACNINENPNWGHIRICPRCNRPTFFDDMGNQHPRVTFGQAVGNVPHELKSLYSEPRRYTATGAYTAAVLACRKMLMHVAVAQGSQAGLSFSEYIDYLAQRGFIPPHGKGWVDHIRRKGNEANHDIVPMSQADAP